MNLDKLYLAITLFMTLYLIIVIVKPSIIYDHKRNCLRQFGIGYRNTTVITLWFASILLAIFSYFVVIYIYYLYDEWF